MSFTGDDHNDLTPIRDWLLADGESYVGADGNMDDGILSFTGYIRIDSPGEVDLRSESDDGSIIWIAGEKVVDNDGSHGAPGPAPDGTYNFESAGLYPIEIAWFNGDWTNDDGGWQSTKLQVDDVLGSWVRGNIYTRSDGVKVYGYIYDAGSDGGAGMNRFGELILG